MNFGQMLAGIVLGLYAGLVAMAPGVTAKVALCIPLVALPLVLWMLAAPARWVKLFLAAALVLPPLPIAIGNSGPHIALAFVAVGLLVGLLRGLEWHLRIDGLATALLALLAILFASVVLAALYSGPSIAAGSLARVLLFGISIYVLLYVRDGPRGRDPDRAFGWVRLLFWVAVASATFACVDFYFQFPAPAGYGPQFIWLASGVFRRAQGVFYEASTLGNVCAFFLDMIAVALFRPRVNRPMPLGAMLAGGAIFAVALVLSFSRASLLNVGGAVATLIWLHRRRIRFGRLVGRLAILSAAAAVILVAAFPNFIQAYWLRISLSLEYLAESPNAVLSGRLRSWEVLRDFLLAHPWHALLGVGYKTLPYSNFVGTTAIADNAYLSSLVETGVLGLAAVIGLNIAILTAAYRAARSEDPQRSFCGTWMFCFWTAQMVQMFSGDLLTYWRVLPVYFCVLALALRKKPDEDSFSGSVL